MRGWAEGVALAVIVGILITVSRWVPAIVVLGVTIGPRRSMETRGALAHSKLANWAKTQHKL